MGFQGLKGFRSVLEDFMGLQWFSILVSEVFQWVEGRSCEFQWIFGDFRDFHVISVVSKAF